MNEKVNIPKAAAERLRYLMFYKFIEALVFYANHPKDYVRAFGTSTAVRTAVIGAKLREARYRKEKQPE